ncbi:hypothetical protein [Kutzneria sp. 744]|uniref:hypothetical protein n=1 Tax=Kutzneria sp. (strain 744) TaxID=345341 RepID=UPI0004AD94DE|nr:hypothetical protein [Kutzneria sp. 744]
MGWRSRACLYARSSPTPCAGELRAASVLHRQSMDRWRLVEFGLPSNAVATTG